MGLSTPARPYAGELEELYRRTLKGLFSKIERFSDSTEGVLSAAGEGDRPARPRRGRRGASAGCPATRVYWPAPVLGEVLGQRQNVDALRAWEGVWLGGPTAAVRGSVGRLSAASADVADRRPGGGDGVR